MAETQLLTISHDFPCWSTVYNHFRDWDHRGIWEKINAKLTQKWREKEGRERKPSAGIVDSQSVRTTEKGVLTGDMTEPKKLREEKDISSLIPKGSYYRLKSAQEILVIKKGW